MKKLQCQICDWIYDEELGSPEDGLAPGTAWADVSEDWSCPICGASKNQFHMIKI